MCTKNSAHKYVAKLAELKIFNEKALVLTKTTQLSHTGMSSCGYHTVSQNVHSGVKL